MWWGPGFCLSLPTWDKTGIKPLQVPSSLQPPYLKKSHTLSYTQWPLFVLVPPAFLLLLFTLSPVNAFLTDLLRATNLLSLSCLFASGFLVFSCVCNLGVLPRLLCLQICLSPPLQYYLRVPLPCIHLRTDLPLSSISSCFACSHFPCRTSHN